MAPACLILSLLVFLFFNDPAPTEIYTLSLHDALPIYGVKVPLKKDEIAEQYASLVSNMPEGLLEPLDRKSTRLNSSHLGISYAVFCLKKKKKTRTRHSDDERTNMEKLHTTTHQEHIDE